MNILRNRAMPRRTFLRGCGAMLALPYLDVMRPRRADRGPGPRRFAALYTPNGYVQDKWAPTGVGRDFTFSQTLQPAEVLRDKITLHTGLDRVKTPGTDGHAQASTCYLSTARPEELSPAGYPLKRTVDQVIADVTGEHTAFRSLELSCNAYRDNRESVYFDNISWYGHGHVARSMKDPRRVFDRLFAVEQHQANASVLDLVLQDAKDLQPKLGRRDQGKLDEYLDAVRAVERQIERITQRQDDLEGVGAARPGDRTKMPRGEYIQVMGDLLVLALQTDLTRVATLMVAPERWDTPLVYEGLFDKPARHHGWTHEQGNPAVKAQLEQIDRFHVQQFVTLAQKMDAIDEGDGSLLDHTVFLLGAGLSSGMLHQCTNLPTLIAGSGGGLFEPAGHVRHAPGTPIANLWLSLARGMGVQADRIGDSTGALPGWKLG